MSSGYVYVLTNKSIPNQVKVGMTTRDVTTRLAELSSATGVPTPFQLEHAVYVDNCELAERTIHSALEEQGLRVSGNREFFTATVAQVATLIEQLGVAQCGADRAIQVFNEGLRVLNGDAETLRSEKQAENLFREAARLGSTEAAVQLAKQLQRRNPIEAFNYAKMAARAGVPEGSYLAGQLLKCAGQGADAIAYFSAFAHACSQKDKLSSLEIAQLTDVYLARAAFASGSFAELPAMPRHLKDVLNELWTRWTTLGRRADEHRIAWLRLWNELAPDELKDRQRRVGMTPSMSGAVKNSIEGALFLCLGMGWLYVVNGFFLDLVGFCWLIAGGLELLVGIAEYASAYHTSKTIRDPVRLE